MGVSSSYDHLCTSILTLSKNALYLAHGFAKDPKNIIMLPYYNFNWVSGVWETSVLHGAIQHDQVSAMLIVLGLPPDSVAMQLASVQQFEERCSARHHMTLQESLEAIMPTSADHLMLRAVSIIHVMTILTEDIVGFSHFKKVIPPLSDPGHQQNGKLCKRS